MPTTAYFSSTTFGSISYFQKLIAQQEVVVDTHENYQKQSDHSRYHIHGANGKLTLSVPVQHIVEERALHARKISYDEPWQKIHWRSLETAYRSSPYFEYYEEKLKPFYIDQFEFLGEFNELSTQLMLDILEVEIPIGSTPEYFRNPDGLDYRSTQLNKSNDDELKPYIQVFEDRNGFIPNLSILDLIFNCGPDAISLIRTA